MKPRSRERGPSVYPPLEPLGPDQFVLACRQLGPQMLSVVAKIANNPRARISQRMAAANSILDRGFGRSTQQLHLLVDDTGGGPGMLEGLGAVEKQQLLLTMKRQIDSSLPQRGRPATKDVSPGTDGAARSHRPLTGPTEPEIGRPDAPDRVIPAERPIQGPPEATAWDRLAVLDPLTEPVEPGPTVEKARRSRGRRQPGEWSGWSPVGGVVPSVKPKPKSS